MNNELKNNSKIGTFLIFPMLIDRESYRINEVAIRYKVETEDIASNVQEMFNNEKNGIAKCWRIEKKKINAELFGEKEDYTLIVDNTYRINIEDMIIYECQGNIALVALLITYSQMEVLERICYPGYTGNKSRYSFDKDLEAVQLESRVQVWLKEQGMRTFYQNSPLFLEAYGYSFAVVPERFQTKREMEQLTFNMHIMVPLTQRVNEDSEKDLHFVYAARDHVLNSYRWGCCVACQRISYVVADETLDFETEKEMQIRDGLPVVMLAMYEKYTCMDIERLMICNPDMGEKERKGLKQRTMKFRLYGTVSYAAISRWYNIREIYSHLLFVFGVQDTIKEISDKIEILSRIKNDES